VSVIPAKAGIQCLFVAAIESTAKSLDSRLRGNDGLEYFKTTLASTIS
jgi:hypothetical protein